MDNVKQIQQALQPLADKIGQGAKIEWQAYYRQVYINAWTTIVFFTIVLILTLILGISMSRWCNRQSKDTDKRDYERENYTIWKWVIRLLTGVFSLIWLGVIITGGVQPLLNPVYQATRDIVGSVKK